MGEKKRKDTFLKCGSAIGGLSIVVSLDEKGQDGTLAISITSILD